MSGHRRIGCAHGDAGAVRGGPDGWGVEPGAEQVQVPAVAEVAEQQHSHVVVVDGARRRSDPAGEPEAGHARARPDGPLRDLDAQMLERPLDVPARHRARIGHLAVVALADHRQHHVAGSPARGEHRGMKDGPHRMRPAEVNGRLDHPPLLDLEIGRQLAHPIDRRDGRERRHGGRRNDRHACALAALCLRLTDQDPGHVGDRIPGAGLDQADRARDVAPALLTHRQRQPPSPGLGRATGRPRAVPARRYAAVGGRLRSHGSKRFGQRG